MTAPTTTPTATTPTVHDGTAPEDRHRGAHRAAFPWPVGDCGFFTDGAHLLIAEEAGLRGVDITSGQQVFAIDGFRPARQDPHAGTLVQVGSATARLWTPPEWTARVG
ncbi:hypothetical protein ACFVUH_30300 [Kitasatospora sp. NPDC058032]|uniref:hypothetical protein n=1 Tax=Kitasatospora sp. NPDC058032 TaxID=3346307 RepID=UPI0036DA4635